MGALKGTERFDEEAYRKLWAESKVARKRDDERCRAMRLRDLCTAHLENRSKDVWKELRSWIKGKTVASTGPVLNRETGELVHSAREIGEVWAEHFGRLAKDGTGNSRAFDRWRVILPETEDKQPLEGCDDPLTWEEVQAALRSIQRRKASGLDGVPGELFKLVEGEETPRSPMARALREVLGEIWDRAEVPDCLAAAVIVPIPKKGDLADPDNYRGIALIAVLLKIVAKIITTRLTTILERERILIKEQAGFRTREECIG